MGHVFAEITLKNVYDMGYARNGDILAGAHGDAWLSLALSSFEGWRIKNSLQFQLA